MNKRVFSVFLVILLTLPLQAQNGKGALLRQGAKAALAEKGGTQVGRSVGRQLERTIVSSVSAAGTRSTGRALTKGAEGGTKGTLSTSLVAEKHSPVPSTNPLVLSPSTHGISEATPPVDLGPLSEALREGQRLSSEQKELETVGVNGGFGRSVLLASSWEDPYIGFSVTVFKINVNGTEEIFGVIPSHGLPREGHLAEDIINISGNDFSVLIKQADGRDTFLPARLVQTSAESMFDISLVKFSPEVERAVAPLELASKDAQLGDKLSSFGYGGGNEIEVSRSINAMSFISARTNQPIEGDRAGFCGSPWLDMQNRVKAIHTGSVVGVPGKADVSYGTHVRFVRLLVDAYTHDGKAMYDFVLNNHKLAILNIDEYISDVELLGADKTPLMKHHFEDKFSQSVVLDGLKNHPNAVYVKTTSRTAVWKDGKLVEDRSAQDPTIRQHLYNLQTKELQWSTPHLL